jgi:hypothetical protein
MGQHTRLMLPSPVALLLALENPKAGGDGQSLAYDEAVKNSDPQAGRPEEK